jgi:hypothetical protein
VLIILIAFNVIWKELEGNIIKVLFEKFVIIFIVLFLIYTLNIPSIQEYFLIRNDITSEKNINIVEGEVYDFETQGWLDFNGSECFKIDGTTFEYQDETYGYCKFKKHGGLITGNGQKLKIYYWNNPNIERASVCDNVIVKIIEVD